MNSPPLPTFGLVLALGLFVAACTAATGNEEGGGFRFDAAPPIVATDGGCDSTEDAGSGTAWSDLYRDFFGPTGAASCAGNGQCHGDPSQPGAAASGYVCGSTAASCYQGITASGAGLVTVGDTTSDPKTTTLYLALRKDCGASGTMPLVPATYSFSAADVARVATWIHAGAPND